MDERIEEEARRAVRDFSQQCVRCGLCARCDCGNYGGQTPCLGDICDSVLAGENDWFHFAFTCSLCNRCTVRCPKGLRCRDASLAVRRLLVAQNPQIKVKYRAFRCDRRHNLFTLLAMRRENRRADGSVDYGRFDAVLGRPDLSTGDAEADELANATAFFTGCTIGAYSPELADAISRWLRHEGIAALTLRVCCGATIVDEGMETEFLAYREKVRALLAEHGIRRLVVACTHCLASLPRLAPGIEIVRLSSLVKQHGLTCDFSGSVTVHDACYDRFGNAAGEVARGCFPNARVIELPHCLANSACCGGSGGVAAYAPAFALYRRDFRAAEIRGAEADRVVTVCDSCAQNFQDIGIDAHHYLEYAFDAPTDWQKASAEISAVFEDPECLALLQDDEEFL